jgi:hypothetical protein
MWHRLFSLKISWDFGDLVRVTRKRGRLTEQLPPSGEGRFAVICFTLRMLKPRSCRPFEMSSAVVSPGNCLITALIGFSDFGWKV